MPPRSCRNGRVLVLGGSDEQDWGNRYRSAELFDPRTGRFTRTGAAVAARGSSCRTPSPSRLGRRARRRWGTRSWIASAAGGSRPVARLDAARYYSTATLLRDGALLVVGGYDQSITPTPRSFLYRP